MLTTVSLLFFNKLSPSDKTENKNKMSFFFNERKSFSPSKRYSCVFYEEIISSRKKSTRGMNFSDPYLIRWYSTNTDVFHPKLETIPIGIGNARYEHGNVPMLLDAVKTFSYVNAILHS